MKKHRVENTLAANFALAVHWAHRPATRTAAAKIE
jgi:hypothetical protein